jgi:DNA-directed RNA polymerase subunit RPC12/RpoP
MRITYACPACHATATHDRVEERSALDCPGCGAVLPVPDAALDRSATVSGGARVRLRRCLVCPGAELFARKDFPQRLGVAIVVAGFAASCVTWGMRLLVPTFAILFATALVDVVLYLLMPECLVCYRCGARYRGDGVSEGAGGFDLESHERHRQGAARARDLAAGRLAGAPAEPRS